MFIPGVEQHLCPGSNSVGKSIDCSQYTRLFEGPETPVCILCNFRFHTKYRLLDNAHAQPS